MTSMTSFNYARAQSTALRRLDKFGATFLAVVRADAPPSNANVAIMNLPDSFPAPREVLRRQSRTAGSSRGKIDARFEQIDRFCWTIGVRLGGGIKGSAEPHRRHCVPASASCSSTPRASINRGFVRIHY